MGDIDRISAPLVEAGAFAGCDELAGQIHDRPWTVQVDARNPAKRHAVVDAWRRGANTAIIRHMSPDPRGRRRLIGHLIDVLGEHGFRAALSPLLDDSSSRPFRRTGFVERERLVVFKKHSTGSRQVRACCEVRPMTISDAEAICAIDQACFDELWRLGVEDVKDMLARVKGLVAVQGEASIGYNMVSVSQETGTVGRLAVSPEHRNRGVGSTLLAAGLSWLADAGGTEVTLCTQHGNLASRRLYSRFGFERLPDDLSLMQRNL